MWFNFGKRRRQQRNKVLNVKLRSDQVRARRVRVASVSLLVAGGTALGLYLLWCLGVWALNVFVYHNPDFAIRRVDIRTDGGLLPEQLRQWAGVSPGENLIALDLARVKRNLEHKPEIASVSVERVLPGTLKLWVKERRPVVQVAGPNGAPVWALDANGVVLPLVELRRERGQTGVLERMPLLTGPDVARLWSGSRVDSPAVQAALRLVAAFPTSPMAGRADLRQVDVSQPGVVLVRTGQGALITFAPGDPELQLRRWRRIYEYGLSRQEKIVSVDLAVANNVPVHFLALSGITPATEPAATPGPPGHHRRRQHV